MDGLSAPVKSAFGGLFVMIQSGKNLPDSYRDYSFFNATS